MAATLLLGSRTPRPIESPPTACKRRPHNQRADRTTEAPCRIPYTWQPHTPTLKSTHVAISPSNTRNHRRSNPKTDTVVIRALETGNRRLI